MAGWLRKSFPDSSLPPDAILPRMSLEELSQTIQSNQPMDEEPELPRSRMEVVILAVLVEGGLVLGSYPLGWMLGSHPLEQFRYQASDLGWGVLATLPLIPLFLMLIHLRLGFLEPLRKISLHTLRPMMSPCTMVDLIGISLLAGVGEEMIFRGVIQGWLAKDTPIWSAILASSISFGFMHSLTPAYFLLATVMGVYLGWLYHWTGNLLAPMMVHFLYDAIALIYITRIWNPPDAPMLREFTPEDEEVETPEE